LKTKVLSKYGVVDWVVVSRA